jgi:hypothetical protein
MLRTVSWVLLAFMAAATLVLGLNSARVAYLADPARDSLVPGRVTVRDLAGWNEDVATSVRARRATAASYAAGHGLLLLAVVLVPYRRGEVWAWWAILGASALVALVAWLRVPLLNTRPGAGTAALQLGITALGLLLDAGRLRGRDGAAPAVS